VRSGCFGGKGGVGDVISTGPVSFEASNTGPEKEDERRRRPSPLAMILALGVAGAAVVDVAAKSVLMEDTTCRYNSLSVQWWYTTE